MNDKSLLYSSSMCGRITPNRWVILKPHDCACAANDVIIDAFWGSWGDSGSRWHDGGHFLWTTNHCAAMVNTAHEAQPDLGLNSLNYLCMTIAIKMVHQYFHSSDLVIKSTYLIKKYWLAWPQAIELYSSRDNFITLKKDSYLYLVVWVDALRPL